MKLSHIHEDPYDMTPEGKPRTFYRGTRRPDVKGRLSTRSFADDPDIAAIYAAEPGGSDMEGIKAKYVPGSTVHTANLEIQNPLDLSDYGHTMTFRDFLQVLQHGKPNGITEEEATRVIIYLINRENDQNKWFFEKSKTNAGPFRYVFYDEEDEETEEELASLTRVETPLQQFKMEWEMTYSESSMMDLASRLVVDTFALIDAPRFKIAAERLGYDGVIHQDEMSGAVVAQDLMGKPVEAIKGIQRGKYQSSSSLDSKYTHITVRPFKDEQIKDLKSEPKGPPPVSENAEYPTRALLTYRNNRPYIRCPFCYANLVGGRFVYGIGNRKMWDTSELELGDVYTPPDRGVCEKCQIAFSPKPPYEMIEKIK